MKLDKTDLKVIEALKENAKLTTSKISKRFNIPITTVHNRIKKLEREGVIKSYVPVFDHHKLGKYVYAISLLKRTQDTDRHKKTFRNRRSCFRNWCQRLLRKNPRK